MWDRECLSHTDVCMRQVAAMTDAVMAYMHRIGFTHTVWAKPMSSRIFDSRRVNRRWWRMGDTNQTWFNHGHPQV